MSHESKKHHSHKKSKYVSPIFHSYRDFKHAPPLSFAIEGFLQNDGATMIGGLSAHGKTFIMLSMVKALLKGRCTKLWDHFEVRETARRVVYLIPESGIGPFTHRLKLFHLLPYVKNHRLRIHTLSKGEMPKLDDPRTLAAVKGAHVFLDTAIRFGDGKENDAADNQHGLATLHFKMLGAGALTITGAHHSAKAFEPQNYMALENVLRGTGDIGAMLCTAWGIKQLDKKRNIIHVENIKSRDFDPCGPFQIVGRPYIDKMHDFRMHKKPGACGSLAEEMKLYKTYRGGASTEAQKNKKANKDLLRQFLHDNPNATAKEHTQRFKKDAGITIKQGWIRKTRAEINKE